MTLKTTNATGANGGARNDAQNRNSDVVTTAEFDSQDRTFSPRWRDHRGLHVTVSPDGASVRIVPCMWDRGQRIDSTRHALTVKLRPAEPVPEFEAAEPARRAEVPTWMVTGAIERARQFGGAS